MTVLEHAIYYAKILGWYVFPVHTTVDGACSCRDVDCKSKAKHPATVNGLKDATRDEAQIRAWWSAGDYNIGVVMEPSGLISYDVDLYHKDLDKLLTLQQILGELPVTVTQLSGSGDGYHLLFKHPGFPVRGVIGGVVVRAKAYIVVAPSKHISGGSYSWHAGLAPGQVPVAELPDAWKEALRKSAEVGAVGMPEQEPPWLAEVPAEKRIADMKAHFAREAGEVKGTSAPGTTFNVVRTAIRAHAVRDPEAALEAAMEFDAKCVPPWGARMARHVWSAYQKAYEPVWGAAYRGEEQRLESLGLENVPVLPAYVAPLDIEVENALEKVRGTRSQERSLDKKMLAEYIIPTNGNAKFLGTYDSLAAEVLVRCCPPGTTDDQMVPYLVKCLVSQEKARALIAEARSKLAPPPVSLSSFANLPVDGAPADPDREIMSELKLGPEGEGVKCSPANIALILSRDPILVGKIRFNVLSKQIEVTAGEFAGMSANTLAIKVMNYLDKKWQLNAPKSHVEDQLLLLAWENQYNPIADYLGSLKWDGISRIDTWLIDYCGAENTEFNRRVGAMWLISGCARGAKPGSKVDTVLVLEGRQGRKKSTILSVLAGPWFSDTPLVIGNKDSMQMTSYRWIIELAELASLRASETEAAKAFFAAKVDNYRPPYGKAPEEFPRFAIFGGSTNEDEGYLVDRENRRYWPVLIDRCDATGLRLVRDQLWAEAFHRYLSAEVNPDYAHPECPGERWWFETEAEQDMAAVVVGKRRPENLWAGLIKEWSKRTGIVGVQGRRQWTLAEIAKGALDIEIEKMPGKQRAITAAVKEAGLLPALGAEGQAMWKLPDLDIPGAVLVAEGLTDSN